MQCVRFLFSESYIQRVGNTLALNLLTAVSNPMTREGRVAISQGILRHVDLRKRLVLESLEEIEENDKNAIGMKFLASLPLVVIQSTENTLVAPSHVDSLVQVNSTMIMNT